MFAPATVDRFSHQGLDGGVLQFDDELGDRFVPIREIIRQSVFVVCKGTRRADGGAQANEPGNR